jgi:DNA (cytosine-5)-methyltransferase 1
MPPKFIDLFCGIGIGAGGFVEAGFDLLTGVDSDAKACEVFETNLGAIPIVGDLREITGEDILRVVGLKRGELDLCVGCPPCQGFSSLRKTRLEKWQKDSRKSYLELFGERIQEIFPKVAVLENVRGLNVGPNRRFLNRFLKRLKSLGYEFVYDVLDAADFGVPQHRKRLIMIASRVGTPSLPEPSHFDPAKTKGGRRWRNVRDAIGDLPRLRSGEKHDSISLHEAADHAESVLRLIRKIPRNGGGRTSLPRNLWLPCHKKLARKKQRGAESIYGRMRWGSPSPTMTTRCNGPSAGRFLHPEQNRGITLREAARLQTIPNSFDIPGHKENVASWIGNAFPLGFAKSLGDSIMDDFWAR